jgi:phage tail protein X
VSCQITTSLGATIELQINPTQVHVENRMDLIEWRSIRGGAYNLGRARLPETITMRVQAPAQRGSWPGTFKFDPDGRILGTDRWQDPQDYLHPLQEVMSKGGGKCFINFPEADIANNYIIVGIDEDHEGGFGDLPIVLNWVLQSSLELLRKSTGEATATAAVTTAAINGPDTNRSLQDGTPRPGQTYHTQQGDTLLSIAQRAYGDENRWIDIFNANVALTNSDPSIVLDGIDLRLPP